MRPYQQGTLALQLGGSPQMPPMPQQMPSGQGMAPPMAPPSNMESQMSGAMGETPPTAPPPMPPGEGGPQQGAPSQIPSIEAPLIQEFENQPHLLAYINEGEVRMLQEKGGGMTPEGEPRLSPEGIPVFLPDDGTMGGPSADVGTTGEFGGEPAPAAAPGMGQPDGPSSAPSSGTETSGPSHNSDGNSEHGDVDEITVPRPGSSDDKDKETDTLGTQTFLGGSHVYRPGVGFVPKESPNDPNAISYAILSGANLANIKPVAANRGVMTQRSGYGAAKADQLLGSSKKK